MDETWVSYSTPESKQQSKEWKHPGSSLPKKSKTVPLARKVMASFLGDADGILMVGADNQWNICFTFYRQLRGNVMVKCCGKLSKDLLFYQNSTPAHTSIIAMAAINGCGFQLIQHPPYFHLFSKLKKFFLVPIFSQMMMSYMQWRSFWTVKKRTLKVALRPFNIAGNSV